MRLRAAGVAVVSSCLSSFLAPLQAQVSVTGAWGAIDLDLTEHVGQSVLVGDFDADGRDDLAYGAWNGSLGMLHVARNTPSGLLNVAMVSGNLHDYCTESLAVGWFDKGASRPRIAVGCPASGLGNGPGLVRIYRLSNSNDQLVLLRELKQGSGGFPGAGEDSDNFGENLTTGDFDGDGADDLVIGASGKVANGQFAAGAVFVVYGDISGLDTSTTQTWTQESPGVPSASEPYDGFGSAFAAGDFDGDGFDDLAIGAYNENVGSGEEGGAVTVLYGSPLGLATSGAGSHPAQWLSQGDGIAPGTAEYGDQFGLRLAAGRIVSDTGTGSANGDEVDLVIGVRNDTVNGQAAAGAVVLLVGRSGGFTSAGARRITQAGLPGAKPEIGDCLGGTLAVIDLSNDGWDDIAIASDLEDALGSVNIGAAHIVYGGAAGIDETSAQFLLPDATYPFAPWGDTDNFADALAGGDLDGDGDGDLVIGSPNWIYRFPDPDIPSPGNVMVLFGAP